MVAFVNNTIPQLLLGDNEFTDETFTAAGANTYPAGTVLGRLTADSKLVVFANAAATGAENPVAILRNELITTGAGDTSIRACIGGKARFDRVTEFGVGTLNKLKEDNLRKTAGIILLVDTELLAFDNVT